jgi:glycosyltransferase involved in cell wall biosynthesis
MADSLRIAFIMPEAPPPTPIGAAKIIYRYADELTARGHRVMLLHPHESLLSSFRYRLDFDPDLVALSSAPRCEQPVAASSPNSTKESSVSWYHSNPEVRFLIVPTLAEEWLEGPYDVVIATNQRTVSWVEDYSEQMGRKLYFVQDYESYMLGDADEREATRNTLHIDWPIVGVSLAIRQLLLSIADRDCRIIPNAIDGDTFRVTVPVNSPQRTLIGFPARKERTKRTWDAVRALELARPHIRPDIQYWCFGYEQIPTIPDWITHHLAPNDDQLCELYNRTIAFLVPSEHEGFGLPGAEAMACGAALISTRNGGVATYARDRYSAILCPPLNPPQLAAALLRILQDRHLHNRIAYEGARSISVWTWPKAVREFESVLMALV